MKHTRVINRGASYCYGCNKVHQLRLLDRNGERVAVISGKDFQFPGNHLDAEGTFNLALALVDQFTRSDSSICPFEGETA